MRRSLLFVFLLAGLLTAQIDPFLGSFSGDQLELQLRRTPDGGYGGQIVFGGQTFPIQATRNGARVEGSFTSQGQSYQFTITSERDSLRFVTDGTLYTLNRIGGQPAATRQSAANPLQATRQSSTPGRRHRHDSGFGFALPQGWTAQDNAEGTFILPAGVVFDPNREDNPEVYIAAMHNAVDPAGERDLVQEMSSEFLKSGVELLRSGDRQPVGQSAAVYHWEFRSPSHPWTVGLKIYVSVAGGRTFVMLAAGEAQKVNGRDAALREILGSMDYQAPKMPEGGALADNTPAAQMWLQKLRGKVIKQFSSAGGGGMTSERTRYLAADGTYSMKSNSVISIDVGPYAQAPTASASGISRNSQTGRWKIRDQGGKIYLQIWTSDGQMLMLPITSDSRNWYLNGEKAFAVNP